MKKIIFLPLVFAGFFASSQDLIIYQDGSDIEAKVLKITTDEVVFKKHSNLTGPEYSESKTNIFMIKYQNGDKDIFNKPVKTLSEKNEDNANTVEVVSGTNIELYLTKTISSKSLKSGQKVPFAVKYDLLSNNGNVIVAANTLVDANVVRAEKARGGGKEGALDIMINHVRAVDGQLIPVFLNINDGGDDKRSESFWVGMLLFWPALFTKGGEAEIQAGTSVIVQTTQNISISTNNKQLITNQFSNNPTTNQQVAPTIIEPPVFNNCGEKPAKPPSFNNPQYKNSKAYKAYKKKLEEWEACKNGN